MGRVVAFFREAAWFNQRRAKVYPRIFALCYLPLLVFGWWLAFSGQGTDFAAFWAGGRLAWEHPAWAWDFHRIQALEQALFPPGRWAPFVNPPPYLLLVAPLGLLPYGAALVLWVAVTLALYVIACRPHLDIWWVAAFPPVLLNGVGGQNGLLTAALFIGAVTLLGKRPFVAGLLFGALVIKPHLALLVPLALLAGRQWRAIAGAAVSSLGLLAASYLILGAGAFQAFLAANVISRAVLASGFHVQIMQTVFSTVQALGGGLGLAWTVQILASLTVAAVVFLVWRARADLIAKGAVLTAAVPLATPYFYSYDLVLIALPLAWVARQGMRQGFLPWERLALGLAFAVPLFGEAIARTSLRINVGAIVLVVLFVTVVRRFAVETPLLRSAARRHDAPRAEAPAW